METRSDQRQPLSRPARVLLIVTAAFFASLLIGPPLVEAGVDWLWFGEVGFRGVWITVLLTRVAIFIAVALVVGGALFLAMLLAYRGRPAFLPGAAERSDRTVPAHGDASVAADRMQRRNMWRRGERSDRPVQLGDGSAVPAGRLDGYRGPGIRS